MGLRLARRQGQQKVVDGSERKRRGGEAGVEGEMIKRITNGQRRCMRRRQVRGVGGEIRGWKNRKQNQRMMKLKAKLFSCFFLSTGDGNEENDARGR